MSSYSTYQEIGIFFHPLWSSAYFMNSNFPLFYGKGRKENYDSEFGSIFFAFWFKKLFYKKK